MRKPFDAQNAAVPRTIPRKPFARRCRPGGAPRASALVVSLALVVLIAILVVGFATTVRLERGVVESHSAKLQADLFNAIGVNIAASRIQQATATNMWMTQPGRIANAAGNTVTFYDLSSGPATNVVPNVSVDLNPPALISEGGLIAHDITLDMPVKWIYVREDGSMIFDPNAAPAYSTGSSKIVGRFAFWTDDLSTRINLNTVTATATNSPDPAAWPGRQNLGVLTNLTATDLAAMRSHRQGAHFESPRGALAATNSSTLRDALALHKMDVTHFNHSPESGLNVFGEPKIVLTTRADRANGRPYFNILTATNADPGINANISSNSYGTLFNTLYGYLSRTNWPIDPGKSFVQKYGATNAAQIVLNLIDYVRSAESTNIIVEASRGSFNGSVFSWGAGVSGPLGLMGNSRRMLITQMGVWVSGTAPFTCNFRTEVYLPNSIGDSTNTVNLWEGNRRMFCEIRGTELGGTGATAPTTPVDQQRIEGYGTLEGGSGPPANRAILRPGEFRTITMPIPLSTNIVTRPVGPFYLRATIRIANNNNVGADIVPLMQDTGTGQAQYTLDPAGTTLAAIGSIAVDDPVANKSRLDWVQTTGNTFGINGKVGTPVSTLGGGASGTPQQDTTAGGALTDVGFGFPAVKGSSKNPRGMVENLGELGRIHTGGRGRLVKGVPWRTLRLQPRAASDTTLPDWLLLNLFAVPDGARGSSAADAAVLQPSSNTVGGLVNVNARIYPFADLPTPVVRTAPLLSVLTGNITNLNLTPAAAAAVATNIFNGTLATGSNPGRWYGDGALTNAKLYALPEQIAEIQGVADGGEATEARLIGILPFLTTRSSVFSVYSVGQKIRQLPNGEIRVLGESRSVTLLERQDNGTVRERTMTELGL